MSRLVVRPEAVADLDSIADYIAKDSVQQALLLIERLQQAMKLVATQPEMGRLRPELAPDIRSFAVGNYVFFYQAIAGGIDVVRVLSGARDLGVLF